MEDVNVFDLDPASFRLNREIVAARARWNPVHQNVGVRRRLERAIPGRPIAKSYAGFHGPLQPKSFPDLTERAGLFPQGGDAG